MASITRQTADPPHSKSLVRRAGFFPPFSGRPAIRGVARNLPPLDSRAKHYYRAEVFLRHGGQSYDIYGYDRQQVIEDILDQLAKPLHFLHISPGSLPWKIATSTSSGGEKTLVK